MLRLLIFLVTLSVRALRALFRIREELVVENLALQQQVAALKKERPRPVLDDVDRAFWVALRASWPGWASRLVIVNPDTVAKLRLDHHVQQRLWHCPGWADCTIATHGARLPKTALVARSLADEK